MDRQLRATKTDGNLLLLEINMGAGHGGKSGRWEGLHEVAETYAFMLTQVGVSTRGEDEIFEITLTAEPEHIDELGHVNNAVWVQWIQQVAVAHWDASPTPAHKEAYYWVVLRTRSTTSARPPTATRSPLAPGSAKRPGRAVRPPVEFSGADGKCGRAKTQWAIIDKAPGRPIRVPAEVVAPSSPE